ncbi:MAG: 1-deoxy-D-xylulose-5-phosphate reductoisomerase [Nitrospirota bacterium]|nr:MAG: 1-deoxy-D-xylulose-5-phosphate reductoisomerase [Nitrospirota bacterium]
MKKITILGSTGSIGTSALQVIDQFQDKFKVSALAAGSNADLLIDQVRKYEPELVGINDVGSYDRLRSEFPSLKIVAGDEGMREVASYPETDFILSSIVGAAGLLPTIEAVKTGKTVGLANKESMVMAGDHVNSIARSSGSMIIPVDSEHSAIFQCLNGQDHRSVRKLILTASGGPFFGRTKDEMKDVTVKEALDHPNWSMGRKITIDSATLMNKGLEVIEAHFLFGAGPENIKVLIHQQSIVHSLVEFIDSSIIAQLSRPDMCGPIAYAMSYPDRLPDVVGSCALDEIGNLSFSEPDGDIFPCLGLAYRALKDGGSMPVVLNAANEVAVSSFLDEKIGFNEIPVFIEKVMNKHNIAHEPGLDDIIEYDKWARLTAEEIIGS